LYGEHYSYDDPVCQSISEMTREVMIATAPVSVGEILDKFPILFKQKLLLKKSQEQIIKARQLVDKFLYQKIAAYKVRFISPVVCLQYLMSRTE